MFTAFENLLKLNIIVNTIKIRNYTPRRALMYVPGNDTRKLNKAFKLDVDCIAMDCEDGVALNQKETARNTIRKLLDNGKPFKARNFDWAVRLNSIDSGLCLDDLKCLLGGSHLPDTLLLPKVDTPEHLKWFSDQLNALIITDRRVDLVIYIESAMAVVNLPDICREAIKLSKGGKFVPTTLVFGGDDLCASIGVTRTQESTEIMYARQKVVLVAKAFGFQAVDMVFIQYKDLAGLKKQSIEGSQMGYTGKQVIHPDQVSLVQEAFMPTQEQIEWATGLLEAFDVHQKDGKGAFNYKGSMIDMPTMRQASNIIALIKAV